MRIYFQVSENFSLSINQRSVKSHLQDPVTGLGEPRKLFMTDPVSELGFKMLSRTGSWRINPENEKSKISDRILNPAQDPVLRRPLVLIKI